MKREDKFGRRIFSDNIWNEMLATGQKLTKIGYRESRKKPNLFFTKTEQSVFFADLRGTEIVPIWDDPRPLFYWQFDGKLPAWKYRRLVKEELMRLGTNGCPCRLSFEVTNNPIFENTSVFIDEEHLIFGWNDGFCRNCGKDFQDEGELCSKECEEKFREKLKEVCEVCGEKIELLKEVRHHVSYSPEKVILVHASCHNKIHKTDLFPHHKPKNEKRQNEMKRVDGD